MSSLVTPGNVISSLGCLVNTRSMEEGGDEPNDWWWYFASSSLLVVLSVVTMLFASFGWVGTCWGAGGHVSSTGEGCSRDTIHSPVLVHFLPVMMVFFPRYLTVTPIFVKVILYPALHSVTTEMSEWEAMPGMAYAFLASWGRLGRLSRHW